MSPKERAALRERDNADSYYRRTLLGQDDDSVGRHAKEAPVVGHSAKYPEARPPWNDPIAKAAMNDAPDQFGVDLTKAPDLGDAPPRRELATSADPDLSSLRDSELLHRRRWAELAMKQTFEDTDKIDQLQGIIDAVDAEQRRRL